MKSRAKQFFENAIMVVIFLVLVQTFLTDFAVIVDWSWSARSIMIYTAFIFDLIFTLEFLLRFFDALYRGEVKKYLFHRQGWVDFIVSVPLLIFSSSPDLYALLTGAVLGGFGGVLNILKVVKSIRIARLLRLLRVLKIFKHIKYADSPMAQRHTSRIVTTVVSSVILSLTVMSFAVSFFYMNDLKTHYYKSQQEAILYVLGNGALEDEGALHEFCQTQTDFLLVLKGDRELYRRSDEAHYAAHYGFTDYDYVSSGDYGFYFDLKPVNRSDAWANLVVFIEILMVIALIMVTYSTHFALNVTDPINIMNKGLTQDNYNLEVAIPEDYADDDIFVLARNFNDEYLTLKARTGQKNKKEEVKLELSDLNDLFKI